MKRGLLWFRRWPVVTSSWLGSTARFEQRRERPSDRECAHARERERERERERRRGGACSAVEPVPSFSQAAVAAAAAAPRRHCT
jgi:hypothetical protein